jgi:dephospho-CoA kinase
LKCGDLVIVYVLAGMPGAGKEEFVIVAKSFGFNIVRMGDVVRAEAAQRGIPENDKGIGGFANAERQAHGLGIWATRCLPLLGSEDVVIDGSRGTVELEVFKQALGEKVRLLGIHTSPAERFVRLQKRGRSDAPQNFEQFVERDARELSWGLGSLIALADVMIVNEGSLAEFRRSILSLLERP